MAINIDKAYEISEDGFAFSDDNGAVLFYIATGSGDPTGSSAPINTWYFRQDTRIMYYKYGSGNNEWRQLCADDIMATDNTQDPAVLSTVQGILDNFGAGNTPAVSQTLIFGDGGNKSSNSYLTNQEVPSNVIGVPVGLANATIRSVFLNNQNTRTGDVEIYANGSLIYTLTLSSESSKTVTGLSVPVTQNAEISVRTRVSLKNPKVVININGDSQ